MRHLFLFILVDTIEEERMGVGTDFGLEAVARRFGAKAETETVRMHTPLEQ